MAGWCGDNGRPTGQSDVDRQIDPLRPRGAAAESGFASDVTRDQAAPIGLTGRRRGKAPHRPIGPRTPNSGSGGRARSARQSPSQQRLGNRSCGRPQDAAHRRCIPTGPGVRRTHRRAVEAPTRRRNSARSLSGVSVGDRASCLPGCPRNSSRQSRSGKGPAQHLRATKPQGIPLPCNLRCD